MLGRIVYTIGGFLSGLVALRFALRLLGANPTSGFVTWVYDWSEPLVRPFAGIFGQQATVTGPGAVTGSVFDWTALIALIVIGLLTSLAGKAGGHH